MGYTSVDGSLFRKMVTNGAINLKNNFQEIDKLNVFPVPDGDTGTNMSMTMMSGINEIQNLDSNSLSDISVKLSRGFLMGARGNSGVILSQFFRGVSIVMKELNGKVAKLNDFIDCLVSGYKTAYSAVQNPVEGTILTVMREAGEATSNARGSFKSLNDVIEFYLKEANKSLANTPNILPVLKEANVVDSGGAGFVKVVEGIKLALEDNMLTLAQAEVASKDAVPQANFETKNIRFAYCTEFIISLKDEKSFEESDLRSPLSIIGDSLVLVKDDDLVKVHVHTNTPGRVLSMAQRYGEFKKIKVENMKEQHTELISEQEAPKAEVKVDSAKKKYGIIAVCFGEGIKDTFKELGVDYIIDGGQTMNPSTESFVKAVNELNAENIIIIPNNSNVIMSAMQTKELCEDKTIEVLRTKNICHGYSAMATFDENQSLEDNIEAMNEAIANVAAIEITYAVRDTSIGGVEIKANDYMGIVNDKIITSTKDRVEACKKALDSCLTEDNYIVTIFAGIHSTQEEVEEISEYAKSLNEEADIIVINGRQDIYSYIISVE